MAHAQEILHQLKLYNFSLGAGDKELTEEIADKGLMTESLEIALKPKKLDIAIEQESIIMRRFRPALRIINNAAELKFADDIESEIWKQRLKNSHEHLKDAILAVGRINLQNSMMEWVGTGWLVKENIIVTNRHVANEFTKSNAQGFEFTAGLEGAVRPDIDFLKEFETSKTRRFNIIKPIYVMPKPGPDIAFFEVEQSSPDGSLAKHITLAKNVHETNNVATIGYPAFDSRIPDVELMEKIYGREYNKKRLAPGAITGTDDVRLFHNCTTLGGNSGSVIIDLQNGEALGLHFSGAFMRTNYAVRADIVQKLLDEVLSGRRPYSSDMSRLPKNKREISASQSSTKKVPTVSQSGDKVSITLPLTISISLGGPISHISQDITIGDDTHSLPFLSAMHADDDIDNNTEAKPEDYIDREGYNPNFLGDANEFHCPLPEVERGRDQVLKFNFEGHSQSELKYQHFSVVMNQVRRMCFFSAVNINGRQTRSAARVGWKWDPRIPREFQIKKECYGNPPKFSRGHMTRRNDPSWGADDETAKRGNTDSMHVTNATPQMQAFNSPIWLELEDFALDNAVEDGMKISVFTGPIFKNNDPEYYGVRVPIAFWKIIAFIHDKTGNLSATGYRLSQEQSLPTEEEFVYGAFKSTRLNMAAQVSIRSIEIETGINFGQLADYDPLSTTESIDGSPEASILLTSTQIRFY